MQMMKIIFAISIAIFMETKRIFLHANDENRIYKQYCSFIKYTHTSRRNLIPYPAEMHTPL